VHEFRNRDSRHRDFDFTEALLDGREEFFNGLMFSLGVDNDAGIEN
jgi:hypothetical protein